MRSLYLKIKLYILLIIFLKVEVSKFDALEEVSAELKLKQLLWDSLSEWDQLQQEWLKVKKKKKLLIFKSFLYYLTLKSW